MGRALLVGLAIALVPAPARADMPAHLTVAGEGACPAARAVARELGRLHPQLRVDLDGDGVRVEVADRGARYEVRAAGGARRLEDGARRCAERATAAAVAATLLFDPPALPAAAAPDDGAGPLAPRESPEPAPRAAASGPAAAAAPSPNATQPSPTLSPNATRPSPTLSPNATRPSPTLSPNAPRPSPTRPMQAPPAMTTLPPPATTPPSPTAPPPSATRAPAVTATPTLTRARPSSPSWRRPSRIELELVGVVDGAPGLDTAAAEVTGGASLRLAVGGRYVAGTFGFTGLAPATATSAGVAVDVVRIPFDAGVRLAAPLGRVEPAVDLGLALTILQLSAPALPDTATNTRLDVGARLAPSVRVALTARLALVFAAQMIVSFAPYDLVVNPSQPTKIGTTPRLWLGGGLGLAARF